MGKKSSSWYKRHVSDEFVKQANKENWRSRAVFKLKEIDTKYDLIKRKSNILDLGAAPGGWSQYAAKKHQDIRITAIDILKMEDIHNVNFVQMKIEDFEENYLKNHNFDKKGWAESTIVIRFWIIAIILALIGLATVKLR